MSNFTLLTMCLWLSEEPKASVDIVVKIKSTRPDRSPYILLTAYGPSFTPIFTESIFFLPISPVFCALRCRVTRNTNPSIICELERWWQSKRYWSLGWRTKGQLPVLVGADKCDSESEVGVACIANWWCREFFLVPSGEREQRRVWHSEWSWVCDGCSMLDSPTRVRLGAICVRQGVSEGSKADVEIPAWAVQRDNHF